MMMRRPFPVLAGGFLFIFFKKQLFSIANTIIIYTSFFKTRR